MKHCKNPNCKEPITYGNAHKECCDKQCYDQARAAAVPEDDKATILSMAKAGKTNKEINAAVRIPQPTISIVLKNLGFDRKARRINNNKAIAAGYTNTRQGNVQLFELITNDFSVMNQVAWNAKCMGVCKGKGEQPDYICGVEKVVKYRSILRAINNGTIKNYSCGCQSPAKKQNDTRFINSQKRNKR